MPAYRDTDRERRIKICSSDFNGLFLVHLPFFLLDLKGEIFLRHIAEGDYDDGRQDLGDSGIDMELFYEQLDEDDVQSDTDHHQHKVAEQLDPAVQRAARKGNVPVQEKAGGKADAKGHEYGSNVSRNSNKTQMDIVLVQDKIEADPVHQDVDHGACATACRIPKGLQRHDPAEGRIKKVDKCRDVIFQLLHRVRLAIK